MFYNEENRATRLSCLIQGRARDSNTVGEAGQTPSLFSFSYQ
jgi:hypothetical protein